MDFHPPQHSSAISCQGFSTFLVFIRWQRWTTTACLRNPRRLRQRMCNLRVLMALRLLGRIRGCRWMLVEGFGCRWFGDVWECLWFPMIFQSFLQHLWTLGGNSMKMAANLQNMLHPVAICGPQGSRDERHEHGWRDQGDWFQRSATCSLSQQCRWLSRHLFHSISSYKFHYVPFIFIMFHSFSFYFKLYPIIYHLIPLIWIQHDGNWQNMTEHYHTLSTYVHILVLSCFILF